MKVGQLNGILECGNERFNFITLKDPLFQLVKQVGKILFDVWIFFCKFFDPPFENGGELYCIFHVTVLLKGLWRWGV